MGLIIDVGGGGGGPSSAVTTVTTFATLPMPPSEGIGAERVTSDTGVLYIWDGAAWNAVAGGGSIVGGTNVGTGPVQWFKDSTGGNLRFRSYESSDGSLNYGLGADTIDSSVNVAQVVSQANITAALGLGGNAFAFTDNAANLTTYPGWNIDPTSHLSNVDITIAPNNLNAYVPAYSWNINVEPLQNSPNDSMALQSFNVNLDATATGFTYGTNGQAGQIMAGGFNYGGNGAAFGFLRHTNLFTGLGNGTDPGTFKGFQAAANSVQISANITLDGPFNGYDYNLNVNASAITTSNFNVIWGSDFSQLPVDVYGYQGWVCQPNIATIKNNHNFNGVTVFPNIITMEGNAGFYGSIIGGSIANIGTSGWTGYGSNTQITNVPATSNINCFNNFSQITTMAATSQYRGVSIGPTITTLRGNYSGLETFPQIAGGDGDVTLFQGNMGQVTTTGTPKVLNLSGQTANGKQSGFDADGVTMNIGGTLIPLSGQSIQEQHVIFTSYNQTGVGAITGTDFLANVFSPDVDFGTVTDSLAAGPALGTSAMVAFAGQMHGHGEIDRLSSLLCGAIFAEDFTLGEFRDVDSVMINAGYTGSCPKATAFYHEVSGAGLFAGTHWGLKVVTDGVENAVPRLAVNTPTFVVSNASVGLEVGGTDRSLLVSRLTTAQETALTPLNGMIIYNTDLNKFRGYEAGAWTNLI